MKVYKGWLRSGIDHMLFETLREHLKIGDKINIQGRMWEVECIF